jgi:DNA-binding transcriptional ArsR family regulator
MAEVLDRTTLKAMSTDTRQEIVKLLVKRPYTASELAKILGKHVTTITEHLGVLERSDVIRKKESNNKWVYYTLTNKGEKFFKPYYSWVLILSFSLVAFAVGIYETLFVQFQATATTMDESAAVRTFNAPAAAVTTVTYDTNLIIGAAAVVVGIILLVAVLRLRNNQEKRLRTLLTKVRLLEER